MSKGLYEYYLWRGVYIGIKPVSLLITAKFLSEGVANYLSLSIIISSVLMASLSFGSYRSLLDPDSDDNLLKASEKNRRSLFIVNMGILFFIAFAVWIFSSEATFVVFIFMFVVTEHMIHDESRLILYSGDRVRWAKLNSIRTSFILIAPLLCYFTGEQYLVSWMFCLFVINLIYSYKTEGLMYDISVYKINQKFLRNYLDHFNYFQSSLISKLSQQSDKIIYGIVLYETLWIYTLTAHLANIVLTYFEIVYMSRFKSRILKVKDFGFSFINRSQTFQMFVVSLLVVVLYYIIFEFYFNEVDSNIYILLFLLFGNYIMATNMMNSERLFWKLKRSKDFHAIEVKSFIVGQLFITPFILFYGFFAFSKLPALFSASFKIIKAKECLRK